MRSDRLLGALTVIVLILLWLVTRPQPDPAAEAAPPTAPSKRPPRPLQPPGESPTVAEQAGPPEEPAVAAFATVADAIGGHLILCPDPSVVSVGGRPGPLSGELQTPGPPGWPRNMFAALDARGVSVIVPPVSGSATIRVDGTGTLGLSWNVEPPEPARCVEMDWISRAIGVFGQVQDEQGRPVHGALVRGCGAQAVSEPSGEFFLAAEIDERCAVSATVVRGGVSVSSAARAVVSLESRDVTDLLLTVERPPAAPAAPVSGETAQSVRKQCEELQDTREKYASRTPQVEAYLQPVLVACEQATQLLESGADAALAEQVLLTAMDPSPPGGADAPPEE